MAKRSPKDPAGDHRLVVIIGSKLSPWGREENGHDSGSPLVWPGAPQARRRACATDPSREGQQREQVR